MNRIPEDLLLWGYGVFKEESDEHAEQVNKHLEDLEWEASVEINRLLKVRDADD